MSIYMERNVQSLSPESVSCQWEFRHMFLAVFWQMWTWLRPKWLYLAWTPKRHYCILFCNILYMLFIVDLYMSFSGDVTHAQTCIALIIGIGSQKCKHEKTAQSTGARGIPGSIQVQGFFTSRNKCLVFTVSVVPFLLHLGLFHLVRGCK